MDAILYKSTTLAMNLKHNLLKVLIMIMSRAYICVTQMNYFDVILHDKIGNVH